jgi:hypothetical protein
LDDFTNQSGNTYTTQNIQFAISGVPQHDPSQQAAAVSWNASNANTFFQTNTAVPVDLSSYKTLDFRISRQCGDAACHQRGPQWHTTTNFSIQLITGNSGSKSGSAQLQDYVSLTGPVGSLIAVTHAKPHPVMITARIPLSVFSGADLTKVSGVRFTFDDTNTDQIFIANVRASSVSGLTGSTLLAAEALPVDNTPLPTDNTPDQNNVNSLKTVTSSSALNGQSGVEITLNSNRPFLPGGEVLLLQIGNQQIGLSRYADNGSTSQITFVLTQDQFAELKQGDHISVQYGDSGASWNFGNVDKTMLNK